MLKRYNVTVKINNNNPFTISYRAKSKGAVYDGVKSFIERTNKNNNIYYLDIKIRRKEENE